MKKPLKSSESDSAPSEAIEQFLKKSEAKLWDGSSELVPFVVFSKALESALKGVRQSGQLLGGLEAIENLLQKEQAGLTKVGSISIAKGRVQAASRLVLLSNDGSDRFYRSADNLSRRFGRRVLLCRLDVGSEVLGRFFGKEASVKALLVMRKDLVSRVLSALVLPSE